MVYTHPSLVSTIPINSCLRTFVHSSKESVIPILSNTNFSSILTSNSLIALSKILFDKVFQYGNLICGLRNLNNSIASGLFIQNNGNSQEIVTCNKCK